VGLKIESFHVRKEKTYSEYVKVLEDLKEGLETAKYQSTRRNI